MARGNNKPGRKLLQSIGTTPSAVDEGIVEFKDNTVLFKPHSVDRSFNLDSSETPKERIPGKPVGFSKFEGEIVKQAYESGGIFDGKGRMLVSKTQKQTHSVEWTVDDIVQSQKDGIMKSVLTHNHPGGGSFSDADFIALAQGKFAEERAVGKNYTYSLIGNKAFFDKYDIDLRTGHRGGNMFTKSASDKINAVVGRLRKDMEKAAERGNSDFYYANELYQFEKKNGREMNSSEKLEAYTHIRNTIVAKKLGLTYIRTPVNKGE